LSVGGKLTPVAAATIKTYSADRPGRWMLSNIWPFRRGHL
jgi:hypothetical protein